MQTSLKSMTMAGDGVSDQFPVGLRVLVVDDDPTCLFILEKMLRNCLYQVTKCNRAEVALSLLRERKNGFDIVISDVHMPDMDGFKLLEHIGLEMDLPVIMMSADDSKNVVMKGVTHGACDYLIKPVRIEELRNIWQHVVRKKKHGWKYFEESVIIDDGERRQKQSEDAEFLSSGNEGNWKNSKRRKEEEDDEAEEGRDDTSTLKKQRVVWSVELHQQFVAAVNQLGIDKAVPKKILELMNVPGLSRENVASHLQLLHNGGDFSHHPLWSTHNCSHLVQKYRLYLKRLSAVSPYQSGLNNSFMGPTEGSFGSISSLNGLDLQALAATGQLPPQSLATLQAAALGRSTTKSGISLPLIDQMNLFSFETPKSRFGDGQQPQPSNNSKPINLLHGIPMTMEPRQLASLHQSQSFRGMNVQPQSRPQLLNSTNGNPLSMGRASGVFTRNDVVENAGRAVFNPVSQSMIDFSVTQNVDLQGNSSPLGNNSRMSSITSNALLQEEVISEMKESRGFAPSYDIFDELHQHKPQDWDLGNAGLTFDASKHANTRGNLNVPPSVLVHQRFSSGQNGVLNRNTSIGKVVFPVREDSGTGNSSNIGQQVNTCLTNNPPRVKAERLSDASHQNTLFPEQFSQEDLMSALLKQQEGIGPFMNEFSFDGYSLDNLPV